MEIICDQCGAVLPQPEWKTIRDGEFDHTYFVCEAYKEMAKRLKERQCSESFQKRVQRLKEDNVKRSRELKEQHPLPPLLLSE